jgi:hypothetical protein
MCTSAVLAYLTIHRVAKCIVSNVSHLTGSFSRTIYHHQGGKLYPDRAAMYFAPISYTSFYEENVGFLRDVEGLNFNVLRRQSEDTLMSGCLKSHMKLRAQDLLRYALARGWSLYVSLCLPCPAPVYPHAFSFASRSHKQTITHTHTQNTHSLTHPHTLEHTNKLKYTSSKHAC